MRTTTLVLGLAVAAALGGAAALLTRSGADAPATQVPVDLGVVVMKGTKAGEFVIEDASDPGTAPVVERRSCSCLSLEFSPETVDGGRRLRGAVRLKPDREGETKGRAIVRVGDRLFELKLSAFVIPPLRADAGRVSLHRDDVSGGFSGDFRLVSFHRGPVPAKPQAPNVTEAALANAQGRVTVGDRVEARAYRGGHYLLAPVHVAASAVAAGPHVRLAIRHEDLGPLTLQVPIDLVRRDMSDGVDRESESWAIVAADGSVLVGDAAIRSGAEVVVAVEGVPARAEPRATGAGAAFRPAVAVSPSALFAKVTVASGGAVPQVLDAPVQVDAAAVARILAAK